MSTGIVLVLHADADSAYAAELAGALAPVPAIAVPLAKGRAMRFGGGASCLLIWSDAVAAELDLSSVVAMVSDSATVICLRSGVVGEELRVRARAVVSAQGSAITDAQHISALFVAPSRQSEIADIGFRAQPAGQSNGRSGSMLMRSALSLTATIAIAGAVSPIIVDRAQATNRPQAAGDLLPDDGDIDTAELDAAEVEAVVLDAQPTLGSLLLAHTEAPEPAPSVQPVSYQPAPEPFRSFVAEPMAMLESPPPMSLDVVLPLGAMGVEVAHAKARHAHLPSTVLPQSGKTNS
jgi:hypothetical protein